MMKDRRYGGDSRGYGGKSRGRGGDSRLHSLTPPSPSRRVSPPPGRFRDRGGYSPPRRRYNGDVEERRESRNLRRDYDRHFDRGGKDYDRGNYNHGDKESGREYDVNFSREDRGNDRVYDWNFIGGDRGNDREYGRNFNRGDGGVRGNDRGYDRSFSRGERNNDGSSSRGGMRASNSDFGDKGRDYGDRGYRNNDGSSSRGGMKASNSDFGDKGRDYGDRGHRNNDGSSSRGGMRTSNYDFGDKGRDNGDRGDRKNDGSSSRGGMRISNYDFGNKGRDYGDRERDRDVEISQSMFRSSGTGEYSRSVYGEGTSSKFQWDHLLDETRNGMKNTIDHGVDGSGVRSDLKYDYQSSKFFDKSRDGLVVDGNPVLAESERRDYGSSSYPMNVTFPTKSSGCVDAIGSGMPISSRYSFNGLQKDENFHFHGMLHGEKFVSGGPVMRDPLATESYKVKSLHYSSIDNDYTMSSSRLKGFDPVTYGSFKGDVSGSLRDECNLPSDGVRLSTGMMTNTTGYDGFNEKSQTRSPMNQEGRFGDPKIYSQSYLDTAEENRREYTYPQVGSGEDGTLPRSTETYRNILGVGEDYSHQDRLRLAVLDPIGDKVDVSSHQGHLRGNRLLDHHSTSLGQSISDHYDAHQSFHAKRTDVEDQGYRGPRPKYEKETIYGPGSSRFGEHNHDYEVAGAHRFHRQESDVLPSREYDPYLGDRNNRFQEKLMMGNVSLSKPYNHRLKRKHAETQFSDHGNMNYVLGDAGELWSNNEESIISSKSLKVGNSKYGKSRRALNVVARHQSPSGTISFSSSSHLRKSHISGTRDIKKRLGPVAQKVHVSQRLLKKYKPSLKKRLGPGPQKNHVTLPWLKNLNAPNLPRIQDDLGGSTRDRGEDPHEDNVTPTKPEPPENSEDFKQLVKIAFFKFVKQLNETPAKRRKYKDQGNAGSLKCIVCRSQEEFVGTESLATHALTCQKFGLRSQHLGFHRALCALAGWKCADNSNNTWSCEKLSDAETVALKENLILWPPVVIIHNSTIGNKNPDQQVIVSTEELEAKLRDMSFGDKTKVYRGKPANQSVMVVEFAGTLSGLQEAVRLHKVYADKNHGRPEFLEVKSWSNRSRGGETESAPVNKVDKILYGYLGIAEDLDQLDFDAKRRRLVKSKKEIEDIAEAPMNTR